jgi:hypothetical protein
MPERQRLLELALKGLEAERAKIDDEIVQIKKELGSRSTVATVSAAGNQTTAPPRTRRRMSAAARKKISEAMKRSHAMRRAAAKK